MNYLFKALGFLGVLSAASCVSDKPRVMTSPPIAVSPGISLPGIKLPRIACVEHRYSTPLACTNAADDFHKSHPSQVFAPLPITPLTYSFRDDADPANPQEVRFTVQVSGTPEPTNTIVNYWEIKQSGGKLKDDIDKAVADLDNIHKCKTIRGPVKDESLAHGKETWRAVMQTTTATIDPPEMQIQTAKISGTFGVIVNPPIP